MASNRILTTELHAGTAWTRVDTYELIDAQTVRRFRLELESLAGSLSGDIELDLSRVRMLSSMAICAVIAVDARLKRSDSRLRLRNVDGECLRVFRHMRLHELLDIQAMSPSELAA